MRMILTVLLFVFVLIPLALFGTCSVVGGGATLVSGVIDLFRLSVLQFVSAVFWGVVWVLLGVGAFLLAARIFNSARHEKAPLIADEHPVDGGHEEKEEGH